MCAVWSLGLAILGLGEVVWFVACGHFGWVWAIRHGASGVARGHLIESDPLLSLGEIKMHGHRGVLGRGVRRRGFLQRGILVRGSRDRRGKFLFPGRARCIVG